MFDMTLPLKKMCGTRCGLKMSKTQFHMPGWVGEVVTRNGEQNEMLFFFLCCFCHVTVLSGRPQTSPAHIVFLFKSTLQPFKFQNQKFPIKATGGL